MALVNLTTFDFFPLFLWARQTDWNRVYKVHKYQFKITRMNKGGSWTPLKIKCSWIKKSVPPRSGPKKIKTTKDYLLLAQKNVYNRPTNNRNWLVFEKRMKLYCRLLPASQCKGLRSGRLGYNCTSCNYSKWQWIYCASPINPIDNWLKSYSAN